MSLVRLLPAWFHAIADYAVGFGLVVVALAVGGSGLAVATGVGLREGNGVLANIMSCTSRPVERWTPAEPVGPFPARHSSNGPELVIPEAI